jgi:hypothetical protein
MVALTIIAICAVTLGVAIIASRRWGPVAALLSGIGAGVIAWVVLSLGWTFWFANS